MAARSVAFPWPRARGYGLFTTRPHSHGPFTVTRKMAQGAGAGMLILSGANGLSNDGNIIVGLAEAIREMAATSAAYDLSTADGVTEALLSGAFNTPLQIAGAAFVFLSAGQCIARFVGLAAVMLAFGLHKQGVTLDDMMTFAQTAIEWAQTAANTVETSA